MALPIDILIATSKRKDYNR